MYKSIIKKVSLSGAIIFAPILFSQTALAVPEDAYISPGTSGMECTQLAPCGSFHDAMDVVGKGGTIHVGDGQYTENINVTKNQINIVADHTGQATVTNDNTSSYGVTIDHFNDVTIKGINFQISTENHGSIYYALHAFNAKNLSLQNDLFTGAGTTAKNSANNRIGGVDINSSFKVSLSDVISKNFSKNGFAFTSQYTEDDQVNSGISLSNITADTNAWSGIAFYTMNSSGTNGHMFRAVSFNGSSTIKNSGQSGIYFDGGKDLNPFNETTPTLNIFSPKLNIVNIGTTNFVNNAFDIVNYQTSNVDATTAAFNGTTGDLMTNTQRTNEKNKIIDNKQFKDLGKVIFYRQATATSPKNGAVKENAGTLRWTKVPGATGYNYQSSNNSTVNDSNNGLQSIIYSTIVTTNHIDASGTAPGTYYWQVQPIFADNSVGVWSDPSQVIVQN